MNITITFDITPRLCAAIRAIVDADRPRVQDSEPETAVESPEPEKATEAQAEAEKPNTRQKRAATEAKDSEPVKAAAPAQAPAPAPAPETSPAGDNSSPAGDAAPEPAASEDTRAPEPAPEPAPAPEKDMSGKGEKGEILSDLTRRALAELDEAGVARDESNRRIRDYGIRHGLKFPSFTALVQILGYADAVAVAKGEIDE